MGEACWSLADLKNYVFTTRTSPPCSRCCKGDDGDDEAPTMRSCISRSAGPSSSKQDYAQAFASLRRRVIARRRKTVPFDIAGVREQNTPRARMLRRRHSSQRRSAAGYPRPLRRYSSSACQAPARRWSSRSSPVTRSVEGTFELPNLLTIVREFDHADAGARWLSGDRARAPPLGASRPARPTLHRGDGAAASATRRTSSTRCRTTSAMWA